MERSNLKYLIALFEISKEKRSGVTREEIAKYLGHKSYNYIFEKNKISEKYIRIDQGISGGIGGGIKTKYYINESGENAVHLMYYFRDYFSEKRKILSKKQKRL